MTFFLSISLMPVSSHITTALNVGMNSLRLKASECASGP